MRSLRTRITLLATGFTFAVLLLVAGSLIAAQQRQLNDAVDAALSDAVADAQLELGVTFRSSGGVRRGSISREAVRILATNSQLIRADGRIEVATGDLRDVEAILDPETAFSDELAGQFRTVVSNRGDRFRVAATPVGENFALIIGYSMADVDESQEALRRSLMVILPFLAGLLAFLLWIVTGRALRPVEAMRREADAISSSQLQTRLTAPRTEELGRLAQTLNAMLERIQNSVEAQQQFVADASHELRSPLTGIRSQLEVNINHPEAAGREEAEQEMLNETIRMQALVEDLLALARSDQGRQHVAKAWVDLDDVVLSEVAAVQHNGIVIDTSTVSAAQLIGNADQLRRVVRNLLSNAVRHANSRVIVSLVENEAGVFLTVGDDGPGVPTAVRDKIFERFIRSEEARDRDSGGSGLGLAISRTIVEGHGGTITLDPGSGSGARFFVHLPSTVVGS
ncbi:MAG: HAMP domain-containing histidine kinase [Acidimicrobiales bacterium]|nr:HAMP domain-containing histidine kinase [Acidimicrobiales bacterium]